MSNLTYECGECHTQITLKKGEPIPVCCKKEMEPLPFCTKAPDPEMARNYEEDEPCNDGTMPRRR
jgi:hypothetical protein